MKDYLLLYNFFGYPAQGPKRALVRKLCANTENVPIRWQLVSAEGKPVLEGKPKPEPVTFGITAYSCDFSAVTWPELYTLRVLFSNGEETVSEPFEVARMPYLSQLSLRLSIHSAKARFARGTQYGGYYDCNSRMGEAYSHGMYLNGLCWFDFLQSKYLAPQEREQLRWAEQEAFDYLMRLFQEDTGEFVNYAPGRSFDPHNFGIHNTAEALYGMVTYLDLIGTESPLPAANTYLACAEKSLDYIVNFPRADAAQYFPIDEWLTVIRCHLYRISGKKEYLQKATETLLSMLPTLDLRQMGITWRQITIFESMWLLRQLSPDLARLPIWQECLTFAEKRLNELLGRNAYRLMPLGDPEHAAQAWDEMRMILVNVRKTTRFGRLKNSDIFLYGLCGCFLYLLTGKSSFCSLAAAAIDFACGLNFGLPGNLITPPVDQEIAAASFIANTDHCVKEWNRWYFRMSNTDWASIVNGYSIVNDEIRYTDETWELGETFILTDGMFLHLSSLYECILNGEMPDYSNPYAKP